MRRILFTLLITPQLVSASWEFKVFDEGVEQSSNDMFLPMYYTHSLCRFDFDIYSNQFEDVVINVPSCSNAYLVVDGYRYDLPNDTQFFLDQNDWSVYQMVYFGVCERAGGGSIPIGYPKLIAGNRTFQVSENGGHTIKNIDGSLHFFFETVHGDVVCTNGVPFIPAGDVIFNGGFDLPSDILFKGGFE